MIYLKTPQQIEQMRPACELISQTLGELAKWIAPGITTRKLDAIATEYIRGNGGRPACLGYGGFPAALCIEVNETVVHGFPSGRVLQEGDIIGIDTVVEKDGFMGDMCYTFPVGEVDEKVLQFLRDVKESLQVGIDACVAGKRIGDVSNAVQTFCEKRGYSVVREMCGHGIGKSMHEDPEVPNYGRRGTGPVIKNGMTLCIEPMINMGSKNVVIEADGWQCRTRDRKLSAHYEHTLAVIDDKATPLTTFEPIREVLKERFI